MAQFKPGFSGNPGGRTKDQREREKKLAEAVRELGGVDGLTYLRVLHEIATIGDDDKARIAAVKELLDRGFGKAPDVVQLEGEADPRVTALLEVMSMSPHQRRQRAAEIDAEEDETPVVDDGVDDT